MNIRILYAINITAILCIISILALYIFLFIKLAVVSTGVFETGKANSIISTIIIFVLEILFIELWAKKSIINKSRLRKTETNENRDQVSKVSHVIAIIAIAALILSAAITLYLIDLTNRLLDCECFASSDFSAIASILFLNCFLIPVRSARSGNSGKSRDTIPN